MSTSESVLPCVGNLLWARVLENVEEKLLLYTLPDILGEAKANTLSDTLGDREAHTLGAM